MRKLLILAALVAAVLFAQATAPLLPVWVGNHYTWARLGPGLMLVGDVLSVKTAPPRIYGLQLLPTPAGAYQLPANAKNAALWINGLRATAGVDYDFVGQDIKPKWEWAPWYVIVADYDAE